jgi:predicted component of type VI protein secretion system
MAPKRLRSETSLGTVDNKLDDDEECENESVAMQSKTVEDFYPDVSS